VWSNYENILNDFIIDHFSEHGALFCYYEYLSNLGIFNIGITFSEVYDYKNNFVRYSHWRINRLKNVDHNYWQEIKANRRDYRDLFVYRID